MVKKPTLGKNGVKKGAWSEDEDNKLRAYIQRYGHWNWCLLPKFAGLSRSGKSCRLRWVNYLRPDVKHGCFTKEEEDLIIELHKKLGNKWSEMAAYLPGRSDNEIKNRWHTHLKKRAQKDNQLVLENEHMIQTIEPDQANKKENYVQNSDLEFQQDLELLLAESPLSSSSTNFSSCWFGGLDSAGSSNDPTQLADITPAETFWTEPFLSDDSSFLLSSDDMFNLPSDLVSPFSSEDMIMPEEILWSSMDSYLECNGDFKN